jgi:uncharacterized protein (DUF362 family)
MNNFSNDKIKRRDFFKQSIAFGAAAIGSKIFIGRNKLFANKSSTALPDLVVIKNGEPDVMFDKSIAEMGGISNFVKKGQKVVIKPNIGWNRGPETGANTNPLLVKRIIESCLEAGANKVYVFDHSCDNPLKCYKTSEIESTAKNAGAVVVPSHDEKYYEEVRIPGTKILKTAKVHELYIDADVIINVPVLKHHSSTRLTIAMKNLMGAVWDRGFYHSNGLNECIAEFCLYRKPDLNVVDAYKVTMRNGPASARPEDVVTKKTLLLSKDIVAVDAASAMIYGIEPEKVKHIVFGSEKNLGNKNLSELNIRRISL